MISLLAATCFPSLMIVAAAGDTMSRRIPNWLSLLTGLSFFPLALAAGMPWSMVGVHAAVGLAVLVAGFLFFSFRLIGGGDAKLLGAAGLWFGLQGLALFLTMTVFAGGVLALVILAWSLVSLHFEITGARISVGLRQIRPSVPYGYAIAAGALIAFPDSWWSRFL